MERHPIDPRLAFKEGHMGTFMPAGVNGEGVVFDPNPPKEISDDEKNNLTLID